jgi:hypothetical protein
MLNYNRQQRYDSLKPLVKELLDEPNENFGFWG